MRRTRREPAQLRLFPSGTLVGSGRAAEIIGCSIDTVQRLLECKELDGYRLTPRGKWLIYFDSIVDYCRRVRETYALEIPQDTKVPIHTKRPTL